MTITPETLQRLEQADKMEKALRALLCVINRDKDGDFFICKEAHDLIRDAQSTLREGMSA